MVDRDIGIYVPDASVPIFRFHFNKIIGPLRNTRTYYSDSNLFNASHHNRRIACFQIPYPYNNSIELEIDAIYDNVDAIIILGSELHANTIDFVRRYDKPKINWFLCGALTQPLVYSKVYQFLDWFTTSIYFYKYVRPDTLSELNPFSVKPYIFDALLGRKKPHRAQAYTYIKEHNLNGIVTYTNDHKLDLVTPNQDQWQWELPGLTNYQNAIWTVDKIKYYGHEMSLSQVIPIGIYNQSAYSLVCETNFDNDYVFFTEKTVKPILARRLFIMLSHRHTLRQLRELGFKTFDTIIDESYDSIEPIAERHAAALAQLHWLCTLDQKIFLTQCRDIVDHNFNLMYSKDWYREIEFPLRHLLLNQ